MKSSIIPAEHITGIKPWQSMVYRIESWLAANGWPFYNYELTNQTEPLSTTLDRTKLSVVHQPDGSVVVSYGS